MRMDITAPRGREGRSTFGFLRLLFASLVIVSHVPELVDGDQHREILNRLTGTTTFGAFAVNGFFVISGFLITGSFVDSRSFRSYFLKRVARIYPAFILASVVTILVVAPLSGAYIQTGVVRAAAGAVFRAAILARPMVPGAFAEHHHYGWADALNGATWTIQYEFLCYLMITLVVLARFHRYPALLATVSGALLIAGRLLPTGILSSLSHEMLFPAPFSSMIRLIGMFLAGAAFYAVRDRLRFPAWAIVGCTLGFAVTLRFAPIADIGFAAFGGYLIFAAARGAAGSWIGHINEKNDISYGLYLYAWPAEQLLIHWFDLTDLLPLGLLTWIVAAACGWASWITVEKPVLEWARDRRGRGSDAPAPAQPTIAIMQRR